jgi:hypothetical protein
MTLHQVQMCFMYFYHISVTGSFFNCILWTSYLRIAVVRNEIVLVTFHLKISHERTEVRESVFELTIMCVEA